MVFDEPYLLNCCDILWVFPRKFCINFEEEHALEKGDLRNG